jgi:CubicO group peptidase (beta-lactamase class C family)
MDMTGADPSFDLYGGGGLVSTVNDLARFYRALLDGHVFAKPRHNSSKPRFCGSSADAAMAVRERWSECRCRRRHDATICANRAWLSWAPLNSTTRGSSDIHRGG